MGKKFKLTPDATNDLKSIGEYTLQQWGSAQAETYVVGLLDAIRAIAETPGLGVDRPEVGEDVKSFPSQRHTIYYMPHDGQIVVFAVLHQSMIPKKHISDRHL